MRKEFLVPFEIDTSMIEEKLERIGYEEVIKSLTGTFRDKVEATLPKRYNRIDWEAFLYRVVNDFLDKHADDIIDTTVLLLAQKVGNRKRWREVLKDIKEGREE